MAEDKGCPEENSGLQKQHSNHEAQMQSQKAGNEQGQIESAVEDDVHNLINWARASPSPDLSMLRRAKLCRGAELWQKKASTEH